MTNPMHQYKHQPMLHTRFKQTVSVTIFLVLVALISTLFFRFSEGIITALTVDIVAMLLLIPLINREKLILAKQIYLWVNLFTISYVIWLTGGLENSSGILGYPMFLMVAALICNPRTFYLVCLFMVAVIGAAGFVTINVLTPVASASFGYWHLAIIYILMGASGFTAWRFNRDMKSALGRLKSEVQKVKTSRSEIERLIHFDPLTGLSSRLNCKETYNSIKHRSDNANQKIYFLFLDVDNFKFINDYYNHATGDELLKKMASRLKELTQAGDIASRLSGDEFLLIISRDKDYSLNEFTHNVLQSVSKPVEVFDHMIEITVSIGVFCTASSSDSFENSLKKADLAMYRAKQLGKNKYYFYDDEIFQKTTRKLQIVNGLKAALKNNDLELFLQPKMNLENGKIHSAEALIRWVRNNPENYSPAEFIPLIESTELICDIGEWVINEACRLCKDLHNNGFEELAISVNVSSAQFVRGGLEDIIINALKKSQLSPEYLELELTEHILFNDDASILEEINRIKDLGLSLSIDDFGTGYSNLSYLSKLNVDSLKIDQSFIKDIHLLPSQFAIVDAIIKMGKSLGLTIIAEGVEKNKEWSELNKLNCDFGQGYLWSKPITSNDFIKLAQEVE